MTFEQLQCFIASVEEHTFLDAAESLHISQSSLSKQIMKLEQELEVELWDRKKRKAVLTKAGLLFYQDARILIKQYTDAKNKLNRYRSQAQYTLSIGTLPILSQYQLTPVFTHFRETHPRLHLSLAMLDKVHHVWQLIGDDELDAVLPRSHPLSSRSSVRLEELRNEDFIFMNPYTSIHQLCSRLCSQAGFTPNILRTARVESILSAVQIGEGISLLAGNSVRIFKPEEIAVVPLEPGIPIPVVLGRMKGRHVTKAMGQFWDYCGRELGR